MPFVFIPDKTPDLRNCSRMRWGNGVDLRVSLNRLRLVGVCRDGSDGAFVMTAESDISKQFDAALRLHHVDAAGVASAPVTLATWANVAIYEGTLVPGRPGSCIAVWTARGWGHQIVARRFTTNLSSPWSGAVALAPANRGVGFVGGASDVDGGAIVAFKDNASDAAANQAFRVQRIRETGSLAWGSSGTALVSPGPSPVMVNETPQVAVGPTSVAVVWHGMFGFNGATLTPSSVFGAWLDFNGSIISPPFTIDVSNHIPGLAQRWVATDPVAGGFYVLIQPNVPAGGSMLPELQVRRFDDLATTARWSAATKQLAGARTYAIAEDGAGGALVATLGNNGTVSLAKFSAASNGNEWAGAAAANVATVPLLMNTSPTGRNMGGSLAVASKNAGGAILVFTTFQRPTAPELRQQCFDTAGGLFGSATAVSFSPGAQDFPLIADVVLPTVAPPAVFKPVTVGGKLTLFDPEQASLACVWEGASGVSSDAISAQKLGCCKKVPSGTVVEIPDFDMPCAVPIDWPPRLPGTINVIFPCRHPQGSFGLLPVPQLALLPGASLPGGLGSPHVPAPDWVRLWFDQVPANVSIELRTHTNRRIGAATPVDIPSATPSSGGIRTLTFKPSAKMSYVLVLTRPNDEANPAAVPLDLRVEFGSAAAPPSAMPETGPKMRQRKSTRRSGRTAARKRTGKRQSKKR